MWNRGVPFQIHMLDLSYALAIFAKHVSSALVLDDTLQLIHVHAQRRSNTVVFFQAFSPHMSAHFVLNS